jgi:hypothetical protein
MIYSAVRRQNTAGGRGTHQVRTWATLAAEWRSAFTRRSFLTSPLAAERTQSSCCWHPACSIANAMVERVRGRDSFSDAFERTLDMGVALPAIARLTPMTTREGDVRVEIVVAATSKSCRPADRWPAPLLPSPGLTRPHGHHLISRAVRGNVETVDRAPGPPDRVLANEIRRAVDGARPGRRQ